MRQRGQPLLPLSMGDTAAETTKYKPLESVADADAGAGHDLVVPATLESAPSSLATINTVKTGSGDLQFSEDFISEPVLVLGVDISHLSSSSQFAVCAVGLFFFSLLYGYLQELLSVELCSRQLGLFLAAAQFTGYTGLSYILQDFVYKKKQRQLSGDNKKQSAERQKIVPLQLYLGLSLLRAVDLAMTNLAMQYINYPAKTLMKSSRVVFTMMFGVLIQRKVYKSADYVIVFAMVAGLALFMHADSTSSAVFEPMGVIMLTISLLCDGAISNVSETIMGHYGVGQDEFIFRLYSIALIAITVAAGVKGDLVSGIAWSMQPGTYQQYLDDAPLEERTWSAWHKMGIMILFSSMGFFGSSCSAAITKNFGALTMSITSTARKATTLFISFAVFNNVCTVEHVAGIAVFISALATKSMRRRKKYQRKNSSISKSDNQDALASPRNYRRSPDRKSRNQPVLLDSSKSVVHIV